LGALQAKAGNGVTVHEAGDGKIEIVVEGGLKPDLEFALQEALPKSERKGLAEAIKEYRSVAKDLLSPAELGEVFVAPRLVAQIQGELEFADTDVFMEFQDWSPLNHPAKLEEGEFNVREMARSFEVDLDGNKLTYHFTNEEEQLALDVNVEGWTNENLAIWLDRQVRQPDLNQTVLLKWLRDLLAYLTGPRNLHIAALMRCKFILARKVREKLAKFRQTARDQAYQRYLFESEAHVETSFENGFEFKDGMYWDQRWYKGRLKFTKHFLGPDQVPAFDGADNGEEVQCAAALDSQPEVRFWLRNVARHPNSFWLPTSTDKFYPDFVALLNDGRILVIEYKGSHIVDSPDTQEKRTIGRLWEQKSEGRGLFLVVEKEVSGRDMRQQIAETIAK
jgi:type III restriction enzyme